MTGSSKRSEPGALASEWLGRLGYADALVAMERRREAVIAGGTEVVWLCEHPPVITLGRSASEADVLAPDGVTVARSSRGGLATYHGPGQLMVYPIVRLRRGLVDFLATVGGALAEVAARLGLEGAEFRRDPAGIWVGDRKLAACGVHIRRRVSIHGFALDIATPASCWDRLVPCGLRERPNSSIASLLGVEPTALPSIAEVAEVAGPILSRALACSTMPYHLRPTSTTA